MRNGHLRLLPRARGGGFGRGGRRCFALRLRVGFFRSRSGFGLNLGLRFGLGFRLRLGLEFGLGLGLHVRFGISLRNALIRLVGARFSFRGRFSVRGVFLGGRQRRLLFGGGEGLRVHSRARDDETAVSVKAEEPLVKPGAVEHQDVAVVVFADDGLGLNDGAKERGGLRVAEHFENAGAETGVPRTVGLPREDFHLFGRHVHFFRQTAHRVEVLHEDPVGGIGRIRHGGPEIDADRVVASERVVFALGGDEFPRLVDLRPVGEKPAGAVRTSARIVPFLATSFQ